MLTVACVRQGTAFGVEYVERLADMVRRNLPEGFPGRFVCFTDRPQDLSHLDSIEIRALTGLREGWWAKMDLFLPSAFAQGERIWYFDLDTVITGPLDELFKYPGAFGILEDVYRKGGLQSAVMSWIHGTPLTNGIREQWAAHGYPTPAGGDQAVLERYWGEWLPALIGGKPWPPDQLQTLYPGRLRSYKAECVWSVPPHTSVVFFHGRPRPHEVLTGWVPNVWKVGGGSSIELVVTANVPLERILYNVRETANHEYVNFTATRESHDQVALICGGGPSLKRQVMLIANLQRGGASVFSCNQVDKFLRDHHIAPNFHVMIDARPEMAAWVNPEGIKLYASMCDPATLRKADQVGDLVMFHKLTEGIDTVLADVLLIGGGTTVGTTTMALAYAMGFRKILCFGMDCSYEDGAHHAYAQALNDGEPIVDAAVGGARFKAAPWMIQQARDWKELATQLVGMGCEIAVHGDGLLSKVVEGMHSTTVELDGLRWPSKDTETRESVLSTLGDLETYVRLCDHRRVAIQAGGNVGVWPLALSKHFETVHTFEPDPLNFECLTANVHAANVHLHREALGEAPGRADLERHPSNCGATAIRAGDAFPVVTIDSLELGLVDLIQLDVEGYELQALKGAAATIERCSPIIVLELKGLGERYGYTDAEVDLTMNTYGYQRIGVAHRDVIYKRIAT